jgi:hypothetical protein
MADKLYAKGARFYIRKPAEFDDLKGVMRQALILIAKGQLAQPARDKFVLGAELNSTQL